MPQNHAQLDPSQPQRWILVSAGDPQDRWAWSGIPESIALALRQRGHDVVRVSADLPPRLERNCVRIARRIRGVAVLGADSPPLVWWRSARLRSAREAWLGSRVVAFGSTFQTPRVDATFEDITVAQHPGLPDSRARDWWKHRQGKIYQAASRCFTSTEWAAASIRTDYAQPPDKVVVAGFGPNIECQAKPKDWSRPRLLWIGADWHRKGGDLLLTAFSRASIPGATLDLVGEHPRIALPAVTGHGVIREPERLAAMFETSTLFVLPSRFDPSPIVLLEAASAGTPLIATRTGGTAEHVGAAGVTVVPDDLDALVAAIRRISQPAVAANYGEAALLQARERTWERVAGRMVDAFAPKPAAVGAATSG